MNSIVNILEDFEKLAYKVLIWIILIPKTIVKIILKPSFAPDYIHEELEHDKESPFDEYMSPMLLYLGVTLVPALAIYFIPTFGLSIVRPAELKAESRQVEFEAESVFRSNTFSLYHQFKWIVWQGCGVVDEEQGIICSEAGFEPRLIEGQVYNEYEGIASLNENREIVGAWSPGDTRILFDDASTVRNFFSHEFTEPGRYWVEIEAANFRLERPDELVEVYSSAAEIYVPLDPQGSVEIIPYGSYDSAPAFATSLTVLPKEDGQDTSWKERFESGQTVFLGLALLLPPLLFALAANLFINSDKKTGLKISETNLKETFYAQCYYFVPVGLTFWAGYYSDTFYTNDLRFDRFWLLVPYLIIILWFIGVEINAIAASSELTRTKKWISPLVVLSCLAVIVGAVYLYGLYGYATDVLRKSSIVSYPTTVALLIMVAIFLRIRKWTKARRGRENRLE